MPACKALRAIWNISRNLHKKCVRKSINGLDEKEHFDQNYLQAKNRRG